MRAPFITRYLNRFTLPIPQVYAYSKSTYNPYIWLDNKDICVKKTCFATGNSHKMGHPTNQGAQMVQSLRAC